MIQHLPAYLRNIIDELRQNTRSSGALHRFWIEAEEIDVAVSDADTKQNEITRLGLGHLKMVVKKHRMERDIHGELKDVGNEDEAWPIHVLTSQQMKELMQGKRVIAGSAMIFIQDETKLFYWEQNNILHTHVPQNHSETLIRLCKQPREKDGKLTPNTKNMPLLYRVTKEMALQSGLSHRYSPEFIFAHEFTTHYNEFAQYLPEFGRLRELCKISVLVRLLDGIHRTNQDSLEAMEFLLSTPLPVVEPDTPSFRSYKMSTQKVCQDITSSLNRLKRELALPTLQEKWSDELRRIKAEIGTLNFTIYSPEVTEHCERWYKQLSKDNPRVSSSRLWDEVINPKKGKLLSNYLSPRKRIS